MKRNLIYHIFPASCSSLHWRWNIDILSKYIHLFNNKIVVSVSIENSDTPGYATDSYESVVERFTNVDTFMGKRITELGYTVKFLKTANYGHLRECVSFYNLLREIESTDKDEITFFAHAKGVRLQRNGLENKIRLWISYMLTKNLSDINMVDELLGSYSCAGAIKGLGGDAAPIVRCNKNVTGKDAWFYDGSYFWFNNYKLFYADNHYNDLLMDWEYGVEWYLCQIFDWKEAYDFTSDEERNVIFAKNRYNSNLWFEILEKFPESVDLFNLEGLI